MEFDVLIRDGFVVDGTGAEPVSADVALKEELIAGDPVRAPAPTRETRIIEVWTDAWLRRLPR